MNYVSFYRSIVMSVAAERLGTLKNHIAGVFVNQTGSLCPKNGDDVVIVSAKRTAICKARRGAFKVCKCSVQNRIVSQTNL